MSAHQWTNGGSEVLILRYCNADGSSYGGFIHPLTVGETVTAPDWKPAAECGGGIHGWPWGLSLGSGKKPDWNATWQVYGVLPCDIVDLGGKCKFRTGTLRHVGDWHSAMMFVLAGQIAYVEHSARGAASATGARGAASATGWSGAASATGWRGAASATGESGAASATGASGAAVVTGLGGKARGGNYGCIALAWWNEKHERSEMLCARTGPDEGMLKPDTWYRVSESGEFVEVTV